MNGRKVGAPFLEDHESLNDPHKRHIPINCRDRKPMITPRISQFDSHDHDESDEGQQFLLMPNKDHISVLSMDHGQLVCKIMPDFSGYTTAPILNTATFVNMSKVLSDKSNEWVVIAGFSDGTIQEWLLCDIFFSRRNNNKVLPRRKFKLPAESRFEISNITSISGKKSGMFFAIVRSKDQTQYLKITVSPCEDSDEKSSWILMEEKNDNQVEILAAFGGKTTKDSDDEKSEFSYAIGQTPLALLCTVSISFDHCLFFVYKTGFSVFYEKESIRKDERFVHFPNKGGVRITCTALSPNGDDLALGYKDGTINVFTSILSLSTTYILDKENGNVTQKLIHPREKVLKRKMHWHSLPVKTLCYMGVPGSRAAPSLLSGAEEAVLVTWNTERGLNRPTHTLPRIAKGCLTHISSYDSSSSMGDSGSMDIIVRSMDNTLQLIHGHNYAVKWKIQGIASAMNECVAPSTPQSEVPSKDTSVILRIDPKTQTPIITRLSGAPGFLHWYDPHHEQVIGELEAAPFNRISRKSPGDEAYPRPTITHFAVSQSGNDFITVDTTLSENLSVGRVCDVGSSKKMSQSTNIKFWSYSKALEEENSKLPYGKGMAYELIAAMPSPHGLLKGGIDALAISPDGTKACSLSHEEGAFHIWKKSKSTLTSNSPVSPLWKRCCKISVPSGYANSLTGAIGFSVQSSMSFSNDGSVLVIAFGDTITLWDHSSAALINTFHAGDSLRDVQFVRYPLDMVLATGASSVSILSPFGDGYLGGMAWSYKVPQGDLVRGEKIELDSVTSIPSKKELAVVMKRIEPANGKEKKSPRLSSRIILIDIMTGRPKLREDKTQYYWVVEGKIESLCDISQIRSEWSNENAVLLALTDKHELLVLSTEEANGNQAVLKPMKHHFFSKTDNASTPALVSDKAPRLESHKKRRTNNAIKNESESNEEEEAIGSYLFDGRSDNTILPTSQLPFLTGSITAAFVGRNLRKRAKANH